MTRFESNIQNIFGNKGKTWLETLSTLVSQASSKWNLRNLSPLKNLTYYYVLSGFQGDNPVVLKMGLDYASLSREAFALKCFSGFGGVKLIAEDQGLLLLEQAIPGTSLKSYFPNKESKAIEISCNVMKTLHKAPIPDDHPFVHIKDWLSALDKEWDIPADKLEKARELRTHLLQTAGPDVLLHGDLHHANILKNASEWTVIDPKGVIGEQSYEAAVFICNPIPDLLKHKSALQIIHKRINAFATSLRVSPDRIRDWCFVQAILSWIWALEDGCDFSYFQNFTKNKIG